MSGEDAPTGGKLIKVKWTKVIVSGPSGTGKSSALKLLAGEEPEPLHKSTPVVQTFLAKDSKEKPWTKLLEKTPTDSDLKQYISEDDHHFIYAVDTGGQAAFLDIAPALLRNNSVNIVTHRLDEKLNDETAFYYSVEGERIGEPIKRKLTNQQVLETAIRSLASVKPHRVGDEILSQGSSFGKPSFIVLGTYKDKENQNEPLPEKDKKLQVMVAGFEDDAKVVKYGSSIIFPVYTLGRTDEEKELADAIRNEVRQSYIEAEIPEVWFKFQSELNHRRKASITEKKVTTVMKRAEFEKIGHKLGMSESVIKSALMFFHDLTFILYFPEILPNIIFLEPQPLFDQLSELISVSFADGADAIEWKGIDLPTTAYDKMKSKGLFEMALLKADGFIEEHYQSEDFLTLLEHLQVIIKLPSSKYYFIPCVLPSYEEDLSKLKDEYKQRLDPLVLRWKGRIIPQGLFCALVLRLFQEKVVDIQEFLAIRRQYRNAIQLPCTAQLRGRILLVDSISHLEVYYSGRPSNGYKVQEKIFEQIGAVVESFCYKAHLSNPEMCFYDDQNELFVVNDDDESKTYPSRQQGWLKEPTTEQWTFYNPNDKILSVKLAIDFLKHKNFNRHKWFLLGEKLELDEDTIDQIESQSDEVDENLFACLSVWLEEKKGNPTKTWDTLKTAM